MEVLVWEFVGIVVTLALAFAWRSRSRTSFWRGGQQRFRALARRQTLAVIFVGLVSFLLNAGIGYLKPVLPRMHDDFSHLLAADTFLHGRLTNPTHPHWEHFETFHVIHQPSYQSKYPPLFGLFLAVGRLCGNPAIGIWLSLAMSCSAVCWMLQIWCRPVWGLLGGLLMATHIGMVQVWGQMYWAAGVGSVMGGAMVYGSLRRLLEQRRARDTAGFMLGLFILANTRPFEGLVIALPAIAVLLRWSVNELRQRFLSTTGRVLVPAIIGAAVIGTCLCYYNWRITGNALRFPYQVHEETYGRASNFLWRPAYAPVVYRHAVLREFHIGFAFQTYESLRTASGFVLGTGVKLMQLGLFLLRPSLLLALLFIRPGLANRWTRLAVFAVGVEMIALLSETFMNPHYFAPATGLVFYLLVQGLRNMRCLSRHRTVNGKLLFRGVVAVSVVSLGLGVIAHLRTRPNPNNPRDIPALKAEERQGMVEHLAEFEGQHLVFVRYSTQHNIFFDWVYNDADIDSAKIVWARPMTGEKNRALLNYFRNRKAWVLNADASPPTLDELKLEATKK